MTRITGMMERLLGDLAGLSKKEGTLLFVRWITGADKSLKIGFFTEWMRSEEDTKLKRTLFVSWMTAERGNPKFLKDICIKASAVCITNGFAGRDTSGIEGWMEQVFENDMTLKPGEVARLAMKKFGVPHRMLLFVKKLARTVKERIRLRRRTEADETCAVSRVSTTTRLLAEGTYSMDVSLAVPDMAACTRPVTQLTLPGLLDEPPSPNSKRMIEDYEILIAPYRPLLAGLSSLEILAELLRLLYEEGDVPSVVDWSGKTSDPEYMNLREHRRFLEILQGISLYDHTYNVLKTALDIARDTFRQRHDLLLPSIIIAALAHDIGKIPSIWRSSNVKSRRHESVGAAKLEDMLRSHGNEVFKKSLTKAVRLHHTGIDNDTNTRIILDADIRAREYEITSADPTVTIKPMREWLDLTQLAEIILPAVNELSIRNRKTVWNAMSFNGIVYCIPEYVRNVLKRLASERKVLDYRLVRQSFQTDNKAVLIECAGMLKERGYLAYDVKDEHFGQRFLFESSVPAIGQRSLYAIPIQERFFPAQPSQLEKRKTDYLKTIVSVRPVVGSYERTR
ncbi:MAG: HD domain protein [Syntrophorhabdaceae bacterium PtaU1.Bin034]|nr:MAG: HD domain protein [Syntrophorhabdus sp. PtaB.Bin184]OPY68047.1 MAG: HD domain protein [Syntrophorhabdaceae bacterium PtaU1.Bin034]